MRSISHDRVETWDRQVGQAITADVGPYDPADWRDPFVFRVPGETYWRMVPAARHLDGPPDHCGLLAQLVSHNLRDWVSVQPFWNSGRYKIPECPDVLSMNVGWYFFSEYAEAGVTRYRVSRSVDGPWLVPDNDAVDARAFYAAKSIELADSRRFLVGWIPSKEGERDAGRWQWGGNMSVREVKQLPEGTLAFCFPPSALDSFEKSLGSAVMRTTLGDAVRYETLLLISDLPCSFLATLTLTVEPGTKEFGVVLNADHDDETGYVVRYELERGRVVFNHCPIDRKGRNPSVKIEQACSLSPGDHVLQLLVDDTILTACLDGSVMLSASMYDFSITRLHFMVTDGQVTLEKLSVAM